MKEIFKEVLLKINPPKEELILIEKAVEQCKEELEKNLKAMKINAEVFVGGSFAKKTLIKKGKYDIDLFVRFDGKYEDKELSRLTEKAVSKLKKSGKISKIHGSRDYFKIEPNDLFFIEIIPVLKIKNPKDAKNITDLSYFHVSYVKRKLNTRKLIEEVKLAKAFCHACNCYGAESYISGFSGYAVELLIYKYKSLLNFIKASIKIKEKEIIDLEKFYKNKLEISMNMNGAKMNSPIILIDPTYKERNVTAALSKETFEKFKKACENFLKSPKVNLFEPKELDIDKIVKSAKKKGEEIVFARLSTEKQEGDVAGSKLLKFYRHLIAELEKFYRVSRKEFMYGGANEAYVFLSGKPREEIILTGPNKNDFENAKRFKNKHKNTFTKEDRIYAKEKINKKMIKFLEDWKAKNSEKVREMAISEWRIQQDKFG